MSYEQRKNEGALFPNDKQGNDKRPDHKGVLDIDGVAWEVAAWEKVSKNGKPYLSLKAELSKRKDVSSEIPATQGRDARTKTPTTQQAQPSVPEKDYWDEGDPLPF